MAYLDKLRKMVWDYDQLDDLDRSSVKYLFEKGRKYEKEKIRKKIQSEVVFPDSPIYPPSEHS